MRNERRTSGSGRGGEKPVAEGRHGARRLLLHLRIVIDSNRPGRGTLRQLRARITDALLAAGFKFDPEDPAYRQTGNATRYTIYRLPYKPAAAGEGALRPAIQIETAVWPLYRPAVDLPVTSFITEAMKRPPEVATIECVSILETAADKFVALTRRAGAELAGLIAEPDPTLVRHLHDLHALRDYYKPAEVAALAREIMQADAAAYGNQFPAYRENPMAETMRAISGLASDEAYRRRYEEFERFMVYGDKIGFGACTETLRELSGYLGNPR